MYADFFNLNELPFSIAPNPRYLYMSPRHQEALAHLLYGIGDGGGFVLLTGEVGTGKTTICHSLLEQLPENVDIALILNPRVNAVELLASLCDELQIPYPDINQTSKKLVDALNGYLLDTHARGRRTVVMIDEAQNLSFEVLEQIRLLTNLETSQTKLLQMILVGQPELNQLLDTQELRQLNQRITARYHLQPLTSSETTQYIKHRITVSGGNPQLFSAATIRTIYRYSKGIPRLINNVCDRSLLGAYSRGLQKVNSQIVKKAASEVLPLSKGRPTFWIPAVTTALLACAGGLYYFFGPVRFAVDHKQLALAPNPLQPNPTRTSDGTEPNSKNKRTRPRSDRQVVLARDLKKVPKQSSENVKPPLTNKQDPDFEKLIRAGNSEIEEAFSVLFAQWRLNKLENSDYSCRGARQLGLKCLTRQSSWKKMIQFNRPVILKFTLNRNKKAYATLIAIDNHQPTLMLDGQRHTFPLRSILSMWQGYYIMLWKPHDPDVPLLKPGITARSVKWLRNQLTRPGVKPSVSAKADHFDNELRMRVAQYQAEHDLTPDAVVGPLTFIHLNNERPNSTIPRLQ